MDPSQVKRDAEGVMRCMECGYRYDLGPREVEARSGSALEEVRRAVAEVPSERLPLRPGPETWSVNAYVHHLRDATNVVVARVRAILSDDRPYLAYHDQERAVEEAHADSIPAAQSLPSVDRNVAAFRELIRGVSEKQWRRIGIHERAGEVRLGDIAQDMVHELEHHAKDIQEVGGDKARPRA